LAAAAAGRAGQLGRPARRVGVALHVCVHLFHRGRGLLQAGGLLLGALRQVGVAAGDLLRAGGDGCRRHRAPAAHHVGQALLHRAQRGQHAAGRCLRRAGTGLRSPCGHARAAPPSATGSAPSWRTMLRAERPGQQRRRTASARARADSITRGKPPASSSATWFSAWMRASWKSISG
jgi:hypothetical protein